MVNHREPAERDIVSRRRFAATADELLHAFTDPGRLAEWWGPSGFTNDFHEFDLRPGGAWRFAMRGPDGMVYEMNKRFVEVHADRVVVDHIQDGHDHRLTMSFAEQDGGTLVEWRMRFDSDAEAARIRDAVIEANEQNFDRLAAHIANRP